MSDSKYMQMRNLAASVKNFCVVDESIFIKIFMRCAQEGSYAITASSISDSF